MDDVGKYVCFGREDGTFCWGRVEREVVVNTMDGPKEAFVLSGMMTCHLSMASVQKHGGERLVRKDSLNLETDVLDAAGLVGGMDDDQLFLLVMRRRLEDAKGLPRGLRNIVLRGEFGEIAEVTDVVEEAAAKVLKERVNIPE